MANSNTHFQSGELVDDYSNENIHLYIASDDDSEDLCKVINWAYGSKPSTTVPGEYTFSWIGTRQVVKADRITLESLRAEIEDKEHRLILVAKLRTPSGLQIVGCIKIESYDKNLQIGDDEKQDVAVEFGLYAVDPDYQSRGIGTLLYNGALRMAKEYFNAQRIYRHVLSSKKNQIDWYHRLGFVETGRFIPYPPQRLYPNIDPDTVKFSILTKHLD
ncbi:unnamed protein product [Adineta ricciae]|uniref:N-acetyltransferase domain-containing protein n=1 Tax=Adineta ricciae TaxID=249248 RepID=A0A815F4P9_ADIRI|nr:unnamed protein product [Adineta ricciae]CAF1491477.1 unnamed protein product [Adineta ricciae]